MIDRRLCAACETRGRTRNGSANLRGCRQVAPGAELRPPGDPHARRVALDIYDQKNPYACAWIRGRVVEVTNEGAEELIDRLAKKYIGQEKYPWRQPGERRVIFKILPEHVSSMMVD